MFHVSLLKKEKGEYQEEDELVDNMEGDNE